MNRRLYELLLGVALLLAVPSGAEAAKKPIFGIGDQTPFMFADARWAQLPLKEVRYVAQWDMFSQPEKLAAADAWMSAAEAAGARPLVAFERSWTPGREKLAPSAAQYRKLIRDFRTRYPHVKQFSPWNEANYSLQPTYRKPKLAASYYKILKRECRGCTVTSPVILDWAQMPKTWVRQFNKATGNKVRLWSVHVYGDMNRLRDHGLRKITKTYKGKIWVTEVAGWVRFGKGWKYDEQRAAKVNRYIFKSARKYRSSVSRWYLYQWRGSAPDHRWDSGLLNPDGTERLGLTAVRDGLRNLGLR